MLRNVHITIIRARWRHTERKRNGERTIATTKNEWLQKHMKSWNLISKIPWTKLRAFTLLILYVKHTHTILWKNLAFVIAPICVQAAHRSRNKRQLCALECEWNRSGNFGDYYFICVFHNCSERWWPHDSSSVQNERWTEHDTSVANQTQKSHQTEAFGSAAANRLR